MENNITIKELLIKKILVIIAIIWSALMSVMFIGHLFTGSASWGLFFVFLGVIWIPFLIAPQIPKLSIVLYMIDLHEANQDQDEQREDQEPYFFDTSKLLSFPKRLICQLLFIKKPDNI